MKKRSMDYRRAWEDVDSVLSAIKCSAKHSELLVAVIRVINVLAGKENWARFIDTVGLDANAVIRYFFPAEKEIDAEKIKIIRELLEYYQLNQAMCSEIPIYVITGTAATLAFSYNYFIPHPLAKAVMLGSGLIAGSFILKNLYVWVVKLRYRHIRYNRRQAIKKKKVGTRPNDKHYGFSCTKTSFA